MKKTFSIFLSLLLAISCLSVGSINAFANTKKTAQEIYLNSSAAVWGDLGNKAYVEFTPSYTGSFEFYCFNQSYGGNVMASIEDFSGETYNTVLNDNNPNLICAATLEAGKTYYYVLESASVSFLYFPVNQIKELPSSMTYPFILTNRFYPMKTLDLFYI